MAMTRSEEGQEPAPRSRGSLMSCEAAEELIQARLDGELTQDELVHMDAHLAACTPCRAVRRRSCAVRRRGPARARPGAWRGLVVGPVAVLVEELARLRSLHFEALRKV